MNYRAIGKILSKILLLEILFMFPGWIFCMADGDTAGANAFLMSMLLILAVAGILYWACRNAAGGFYAREGFVTTGISWVAMSVLGCLPFYLSGAIPAFIDCLFEMVSGFTTTGSSILKDVEALSRGMLYWRSFSHWVGGMGVLVFLMAVVPMGKSNEGYTLHILRAESPGPSVGKLVPRMRKTASILYAIYIALTLIDFSLLLAVGRMPWFDAMCVTFGTAGTGGFAVLNSSLASYTPAAQTITTVFMFLFGTNFSCFYLLLLKRFREVLHDEELHVYLGIIFVSIGLITWNIYGIYGSFGLALHHAAFQVGSIMSTTGFATVDFDAWPVFSKTILMLLMIGGACAGSTGGGMKISRIVLAAKSLKRNIRRNLHPHEVMRVRVNGVPVEEQVLRNLSGYLIAYFMIILLSVVLLSLDGYSIETNLSATLATFNNIGPGMAIVGPACNYSMYSAFSKCVLIFNMLAGRLEIFPILILFTPSTWKKA